MPTGGELLVRALREHGVEVVFGIPGTHNLEIYRHLGPDDEGRAVRHITPRHEQGAGYAADAYARVTGRPGVVITTSGPGALNVAAAAGQAYSDSVPMLILSAGLPLAHQRGAGRLHEARDQAAAFAGVCASVRVHAPEEIPHLLATVFAGFRAERPRPVYVEIPYDMLAATAPAGVPAPIETGTPEPPEHAVVAAARALAGADRPVVVAGGGAHRTGAGLLACAELLRAPVVTTANGKGAFPESHPLSLGAALHVPEVRALVEGADVVLAVGTELAETDTWDGPPRPAGRVVRIDLDAAQVHRPVVADPALVGDAATTLDRLLKHLADLVADSGRALRPRNPAGHRSGSWAPIVDELRAACPPGTILVNDSARVCYYGALTGFPIDPPGRFLYPTGFGTLGYALPAAIGARIAAPGRPVVALSGDGGLQFTINELATAVELGGPLPIVVVTDGGYGQIRQEMRDLGYPPIGVDLRNPDFVALARAYGAMGERLSGPSGLRAAVERALAAPVPTLLEIPDPTTGGD